ncbi:hypothetical protein ACFVWP_34605 [Streptomyces sp. NPDC058175]|uniref:hypothetical protein n=1 Tax=Streptomyces sp. NPDC058175 TaxID=3346367 RepID=UPI0036EF9144
MQGGAGVKQAVRGNDELAVLLARVGEEDAGESGLKDVTSPAFVLREDDDVVAAAGYQAWPQSVAHLSVLVAPGHRGEGWRGLWRLLSIRIRAFTVSRLAVYTASLPGTSDGPVRSGLGAGGGDRAFRMGEVNVSAIPPRRLTELSRYGVDGKASLRLATAVYLTSRARHQTQGPAGGTSSLRLDLTLKGKV